MKGIQVPYLAFAPFTLSSCAFIGLLIYNLFAFFSGSDKFAPYTSGMLGFPVANVALTVVHIICAYAGSATMYARYTVLRNRQSEYVKTHTWANIILLALGLLASQGYVLENNFPVLVFPEVHIAGVLTATVCASAYTLINTVISYRTPEKKDSRFTCHVRLVISITTILTLALDSTFDFIFVWIIQENAQIYEIINIARVISEWLSTITFYGYLATFVPDLIIYGFRIPKNMEEDCFYILPSLDDVEANIQKMEGS
ncbi:DNA damage-regulated autophagy modulator protein 1 [Xenopus laevis]|uniref:DNA damage-regulated autophagy modulator protein 1 n=2 Tax=Xenopus laevis TaxID=8355 RepID=A0A1L8G9G6_XENLA|nr:DNA damage-regulated autophagy modulator protein 1 [Xenopus laevis]OCT80502.1 hypothetical protein XELAEV_18027314mg [Xenopus laevis]